MRDGNAGLSRGLIQLSQRGLYDWSVEDFLASPLAIAKERRYGDHRQKLIRRHLFARG